MTLTPERSGWFGPSLMIVGAVTALRWILLGFNRTDLFADESQYWLWGQQFALGYYSKPPLIAWLVGTITTIAGSDSQFWVRMPGAALHGLTAVILAALAAQMYGPRQAVLAKYAAVYFLAGVALGAVFRADMRISGVTRRFFWAHLALWWLRTSRGTLPTT